MCFMTVYNPPPPVIMPYIFQIYLETVMALAKLIVNSKSSAFENNCSKNCVL